MFQTFDFHGLLADLRLEEKKEKVLQIYKLIFRFSIDKLIYYIKDDFFLILFLYYFQDTQMKRAHQREVLKKNSKAYYRAVENIINLSDK